jgi:UDP-glucose 4-epimerase
LKNTLSWQPSHNDLEKIVRTAFEWEQKLAARDE